MSLRILSGEPDARIEIRVSCTKLKNKDLLSKSDPLCIMYMQAGESWKEVGRTEMLKNNTNPQFAKTIQADYYFQEVQRIRFDVYDVDSKSQKLTDDDHLGFFETTLGEVVSGSPYTKPLILKGKQLESTITLHVEELLKNQEILHMIFRAQKLDKKDLLGKTDAFLTFSRKSGENTWTPVLKTEVKKNDLNPTWHPLRVKVSQLCGGDYDTPIRVDCFDYDSSNAHDLVGTFTTSVRELIQEGTGKQWPLINPKKQKKSSYQNSGIVILNLCEISKTFTFLDFVTGGLQIGVTIAIDFTGSNGKLTSPESLHYIGGKEPNAYVRAIEAVGSVVQDYDSDKVFPTFGFGAKIPPHMEVSQVFPLNFKTNSPNCAGVRGVVDAYKSALSHVELFGPTNFAPVINHVAKFAAAAQLERSARNYFVLLILTDGVVTDMQETIHAVVAASHLPLSIIIVGIGGSDFEAMNVLDGEVRDEVQGTKTRRDIVQFVAFRDHEHSNTLAKNVLAEVPRQVCEYYAMYNIQPGTGARRGSNAH